MYESKKANIAPVLTIALAFINILWYIVVFSFAADPIQSIDAGSVQNVEGIENQINQSETSSHVEYTDRSWVSKFFITIYNLPFWLRAFTITFQLVIITVCILAWVRGL